MNDSDVLGSIPEPDNALAVSPQNLTNQPDALSPNDRDNLQRLLRQCVELLGADSQLANASEQSSTLGGSSRKSLEPFEAPPFFGLESLEALLRHAADQSVSGIHFAPGKPVMVNHLGRMARLTHRELSHEEVAMLATLMQKEQAPAIVLSGKPIRSAYTFHHQGIPYRFRLQTTGVEESFVNGLHIAARVLPPAPPAFDELGLPKGLREAMLDNSEGLIVVSGPTGSGKTTLLASALVALAQREALNILTYEEPIEYVHPPYFDSGSIVHQTEVGSLVGSWEEAVETALRREPHVVLVGELLDHPTIKAILRLGLTGHLCMTTLHATGFAQSLGVLFDLFPPEYRQQALRSLLQILRVVVSQRLLPTVDGKRTAVWEYLPFNPSVVERLLDTNNLPLTSKLIVQDYGYRFRDSLQEKFDDGIISEAVYRRGLKDLCGITF